MDSPKPTPSDKHKAQARERFEPEENHETPFPMPMLLLVAAITLFGFGYFLLFTGDGKINGGDQRTAVAYVDPSVEKAPDGEALFQQNCATCHQPTGMGVKGSFPPLVDSEWLLKTEEIPIMIVLKGLQGEINVKGETYNGQMIALGAMLNDEKLAAVLTYARSAWGNNAPAITPETVAQIREKYAAQKTAWQGEKELKAKVK